MTVGVTVNLLIKSYVRRIGVTVNLLIRSYVR